MKKLFALVNPFVVLLARSFAHSFGQPSSGRAVLYWSSQWPTLSDSSEFCA